MMNDVSNKQQRAPDGNINGETYSILLQNVDLYTGLPLAGAAFELSYDRMPDKPMAFSCNNEGRAEFTLEDTGQYTLKQTKTKTSYKIIPSPIVINVTTSSFEVVGDQESDWYDYDNSTSTLIVKNSPKTDPGPSLKPDHQPPELPSDIIELFLKNIDEKGDLLRGAEFKLINPSAEERIINWDNIPLGSFPILKLNMQGEWKLEQTKAPLGYQFIPAPLLIRFAAAKVMVDGDETSDWFDFNSASRTLTIKNTPEPTKYVTNNSLAELIRLVKAQSSKVLNVTVNHTIDTYTPMGTPTNKKKYYADVPCTKSKTTMNCQISPADSVEDVSLLTYAEPMDGFVRCYFSEQPTESYIVDSIELTPVTSIIPPPKIYGIQRDITNPSPEWTRTDDAVGMTAKASVGTVAGSSDFSKCMPWKGMVRENIGTDVMVKIPKFYFKRYREGNVEFIKIADGPADGFTLHPAFNHAGVEKDFVYVGAYKTSSNNKSVSGAKPQGSQTRSTMRDNAKSKGAGWGLIDIAALSAIQMLFLVEYATNDSQKAIGRGYCDDNNDALNTGTCNNVPNLTGRPAGTDGKVDVVYRGIEGIWGNIRELIDGVNFNDGTIYVCDDPSKYKDDTSSGYTALTYKRPDSNSYITRVGVDTKTNSHIMLPETASGGSETTYFCDYMYFDSGWRVLPASGYWNGGSQCGLFFSSCTYGSSDTYPSIGSRLLYIPS